MRTRDAAASIHDGALRRDALSDARFRTVDYAAIGAAALRSLRSRRARDADDGAPGERFVKAGCQFLHGDLHPDCGDAELRYNGPKITMAQADDVMTGLGYEMTGRTDVGAGYEHPDHDGRINLVAAAPSGAKDRRTRDDDETGGAGGGSDVPSSGYGGGDFMAGMQRDSQVGSSIGREGGGPDAGDI